LANPSAYEYTDNDVANIVSALKDEIDALELRLTTRRSPSTVGFKLQD